MGKRKDVKVAQTAKAAAAPAVSADAAAQKLAQHVARTKEFHTNWRNSIKNIAFALIFIMIYKIYKKSLKFEGSELITQCTQEGISAVVAVCCGLYFHFHQRDGISRLLLAAKVFAATHFTLWACKFTIVTAAKHLKWLSVEPPIGALYCVFALLAEYYMQSVEVKITRTLKQADNIVAATKKTK